MFDLILNSFQVSVLMGCLYEGVATLACHFIELQSEEKARGFEPIINSFASAFACVLGISVIPLIGQTASLCTCSLTKLYFSGIHLTGMYCNPIVASACTLNCDGVDTKGHLIVYWVGPLVGWLQAELVHKKISGETEGGHKHAD